MPGPQSIFVCRALVKRRAGAGADFELQVPELRILAGEVVILRGMSGCGKSTLLDILSLALQPDAAGAFSFRPGERPPIDVRRLWREHNFDGLGHLRSAHIGYVLQTGGLLPFLTARENIGLPCDLLGRDPSDQIIALAQRLGITGQLDRLPRELSVGERQRVAIARALVHRPSVVLADEPTASVDPINAGEILGLFLDLVRQTGVTAIIATHDWQPDSLRGVRVLSHRIECSGKTTRSFFWG